MNIMQLHGLIAATYTPMTEDGSLNLPAVEPMVEKLIGDGVSGLYVCGSTGEGVSMTTNERLQVAEAFVKSSSGKVPVIVQVGHNCLEDAKVLAKGAEKIGAAAISATCPSYFKISTTEILTQSMKQIALAASELPFYYYHIPALTGSPICMEQFLAESEIEIPNLVGLKYTDTLIHKYQSCLELQNRKFNCLWGCDEMFLAALSVGGKGAVGSTYNLIAPTYIKMIQAFTDKDLQLAGRLQQKAIQFVTEISRFPYHSAMKHVMNRLGWDVGVCRLPHPPLNKQQKHLLDQFVGESDFFQES